MAGCRKRAKFCSKLPKAKLFSKTDKLILSFIPMGQLPLYGWMKFGHFAVLRRFERLRWLQIIDAVVSIAADLLPEYARNAKVAEELRSLFTKWRTIDRGLGDNTELKVIDAVNKLRDLVTLEVMSPVFAYLLQAVNRFTLLMIPVGFRN